MKKQIILLTSYPSRECGIATFSKDLYNVLHNLYGHHLTICVCALENGPKKRNYPEEVRFQLDAENPLAFKQFATSVNEQEEVHGVLIQHEFGLYGGPLGENLLLFTSFLQKPYFVQFHTVLPQPCPKRKIVVQKIAQRAAAIIAMTKHAGSILRKDYGLAEDSIHIIPHGSHPVILQDKGVLKEKWHVENRLIVSTFGLISENKNIETTLLALPERLHKFPNILFLIVGKTHPEVVRHEGESYRFKLEEMIQGLGLRNHVHFINSFLPLEELLEILQLTDIYLFTSKDRNQAVSGTFTYAMGCGCPIISTEIPHASEILTQDTGLLVPFENPEALGEAMDTLLGNENTRSHMRFQALHHAKSGEWNNVGLKLGRLLFGDQQNWVSVTLPPFRLKHLVHLTREEGVVQFCKLHEPDIESGYTLDDNARALVLACEYLQRKRDRYVLLLIDKYLRFIKTCQQENGMFVNYIDADGMYHAQNENENLEDSNGRAIWALGKLLSIEDWIPTSMVASASNCLQLTYENVAGFSSPRALAFAMKGLFLSTHNRNDFQAEKLIRTFGYRLLNLYQENKEENWHWFEDTLTYGNSILPEALLYAYLKNGESVYLSGALESLHFLVKKLFKNGYLTSIPNHSWYHRSGDDISERGGEQPIDVAYLVLTLELFHQVTGDPHYLYTKEKAFSWFLGNNHLQQFIYHPATGGCCDGLEAHNVNLNQGAESTICYLLARLCMDKDAMLINNRVNSENIQSEIVNLSV
jgi:glycosyltransferase involved in cell wall biosynthesis